MTALNNTVVYSVRDDLKPFRVGRINDFSQTQTIVLPARARRGGGALTQTDGLARCELRRRP